MNSARKKAAESMEKTDLVIEVLDARLPEASSNPMITELRKARQRPCLKILNKSDLADPARLPDTKTKTSDPTPVLSDAGYPPTALFALDDP